MMAEINDWVARFNGDWTWIVQVFLVVLVTAFASFFVKRLLSVVELFLLLVMR